MAGPEFIGVDYSDGQECTVIGEKLEDGTVLIKEIKWQFDADHHPLREIE